MLFLLLFDVPNSHFKMKSVLTQTDGPSFPRDSVMAGGPAACPATISHFHTV